MTAGAGQRLVHYPAGLDEGVCGSGWRVPAKGEYRVTSLPPYVSSRYYAVVDIGAALERSRSRQRVALSDRACRSAPLLLAQVVGTSTCPGKKSTHTPRPSSAKSHPVRADLYLLNREDAGGRVFGPYGLSRTSVGSRRALADREQGWHKTTPLHSTTTDAATPEVALEAPK